MVPLRSRREQTVGSGMQKEATVKKHVAPATPSSLNVKVLSPILMPSTITPSSPMYVLKFRRSMTPDQPGLGSQKYV